MDLELGFISKIIETEQVRQPIENKITPDFLYGKHKPIYKFMVDYYKDYRKTPSLDVIQREFPDFNVEPADEPLDYYMDELRSRKKYNLVLEGIKTITEHLENDELKIAEENLYKLASKLATEVNVTRDINYFDNVEERIENYLYKKEHQGIDGVPIGIDPIDNITGGAHPGELITILGNPSTGKTWVEVAVVVKTAIEQGYRTLFITKEMEPVQIAQRMDAPLLGFNYDELRRGLLAYQDEERYFEELQNLRENYEESDLVISGDDGEGTVTTIQAKIDEHNPDLVIIDGSYLIIDEEGGRSFHERAMNITRGLKRIARKIEVPIYNSTQANRKTGRDNAPSMEDVSFTYSYSYNSDVIISIYRPDELKEAGKLGMSLAKVREGNDMGNFVLNWDFEDMSTFGTLASDLTGADLEDEDEDVVIY